MQNPLSPFPLLPRPLQNFQLEIAGGNLAWLNPFRPEVQQFLTDLIVEVVQRYPVDGIQLDDHFGLPVIFGYDPYTTALYQAEHGGAAPPEDFSDAEWVAWRADRITQLMEKITQAVKQADPAAVVSISPNPPSFAYSKYLQDWRRWVDLGLVDEVVVQVYRNDLAVLENDLYNSGFYDLRDQVPIAIGLYTGPFLRAKPTSTSERKLGYHWMTPVREGKNLAPTRTKISEFRASGTRSTVAVDQSPSYAAANCPESQDYSVGGWG